MTRKCTVFRGRSPRVGIAMMAGAIAASSSVALAQIPSAWLSPADGNWTDPTKWSTNPNYPNNGTPPGINYIANVIVTGAPFTISLNDNVTVSTLNFASTSATLAMSGGTLNTTNRWTVGGTINHTGGAMNLTTGLLNVADLHGQSIYNHSGGTLNFGQYFEVGVLVGDNAQYNISNNAVMNGGTLLVAANFGNGTLTQTGGLVRLNTMLDIADGVEEVPVGVYNLSGGTLQVTNPGTPVTQFIGASGFGTFNQTGGVNTMDSGPFNSIVMGADIGSEGTYLLSGGTLQSAANVVGLDGSGTFLQSGGHQTIAGVMRIGRNANAPGYFGLSGNAVLISNGQVNVGSTGFGTFNQSGGTYTVNAPMIISANTVSRGRYTMSGGTLNAQALTISAVGAGTFEQSGGVASFTTVDGAGTIAASGSGQFTANYVRMGFLSLADTARVSIRPNGTAAAVSLLNTLSFAGGATPSGTLDLANNDLKVANGIAATMQAQIRNARNGGLWNQPGITSSAALAAVPKNTTLGLLTGAEYNALNDPDTFDGFAVAPTDVLVKYTWYGDTDFNGTVNFDDYSRTDAGFLNNRSGWSNGDFDYSGVVNFDDYGLIDLAFNSQSGTLRQAIWFLEGGGKVTEGMGGPALQMVQDHFTQFGESYATSFLNAVPEPSSVVALSTIALMGIRRRRRRA